MGQDRVIKGPSSIVIIISFDTVISCPKAAAIAFRVTSSWVGPTQRVNQIRYMMKKRERGGGLNDERRVVGK